MWSTYFYVVLHISCGKGRKGFWNHKWWFQIFPRMNRILFAFTMTVYCIARLYSHHAIFSYNAFFFSLLHQKKQEQKAPDKEDIMKVTAQLTARQVDRMVTQHNLRDVRDFIFTSFFFKEVVKVNCYFFTINLKNIIFLHSSNNLLVLCSPTAGTRI